MQDNLLTPENEALRNEARRNEAGQEAQHAGMKPANLPQKFWDEKSASVRLDALSQSYQELEKKFSSRSPVPEKPEDYCVDCSHGLFEPDQSINQILHGKGFSQEQVQTVYDLAAERLVPLILDMAAEFQAEREVERLVEHFGGADQWKEISRQLLSYGQKNLPKDVFEGLSASFDGVLALYRMMKAEQPKVSGESENTGLAAEEQDLQSMMRDPKYWRDQDPALIRKVTEGFQKLYRS